MKRRIQQSAVMLSVLSLFVLFPLTGYSANIPAGTRLAEKQILIEGNGAEPATLDPQLASANTPEEAILQNFFEGLVNIDNEGEIKPGQAQSWSHSTDGKTWIFKLRESALWSDNTEVTAHDFVYAWQRLANPETAAPSSNLLEKAAVQNAEQIIKGKLSPEKLGIKAIDAHTLQIKLEKPVPYFLEVLALPPLMPAKSTVVNKYGKSWTQPDHFVSNGPYTLDKWVVNERIEGKKNRYYWDNQNTIITRVIYLPIASASSEYKRYSAGEINYTNFIPLNYYKAISAKAPERIHSRGMLGTYIYSFNTNRKPFDNPRVRKALSLAINRELIAHAVVGQQQQPAYSVIPDSLKNYTSRPAEGEKQDPQESLAKARKLLTEAGYSATNPLQVTVLYNSSESHQKIALAIASMWKSLGVDVTLQNMEWNAYRASIQQGDFQISRSFAIASYNDPSALLDRFHSNSPENESGYSNKTLDKLLDSARSELNPSQREALYQQAEEILFQDMPVIPIYQYVQQHLISPNLKGLPTAPVTNLMARELYFTADPA